MPNLEEEVSQLKTYFKHHRIVTYASITFMVLLSFVTLASFQSLNTEQAYTVGSRADENGACYTIIGPGGGTGGGVNSCPVGGTYQFIRIRCASGQMRQIRAQDCGYGTCTSLENLKSCAALQAPRICRCLPTPTPTATPIPTSTPTPTPTILPNCGASCIFYSDDSDTPTGCVGGAVCIPRKPSSCTIGQPCQGTCGGAVCEPTPTQPVSCEPAPGEFCTPVFSCKTSNNLGCNQGEICKATSCTDGSRKYYCCGGPPPPDTIQQSQGGSGSSINQGAAQ